MVTAFFLGRTERAARAAELQLCAQARTVGMEQLDGAVAPAAGLDPTCRLWPRVCSLTVCWARALGWAVGPSIQGCTPLRV